MLNKLDTIMNIRISSIHFNADAKLTEYVEKKLEKLNQIFDRIVSVDVKLKLENNGQVRDKIIEVRVQVPNETLIATETSKTFEAATDKVVDTMVRQVKKYKQKLSPRYS